MFMQHVSHPLANIGRRTLHRVVCKSIEGSAAMYVAACTFPRGTSNSSCSKNVPCGDSGSCTYILTTLGLFDREGKGCFSAVWST